MDYHMITSERQRGCGYSSPKCPSLLESGREKVYLPVNPESLNWASRPHPLQSLIPMLRFQTAGESHGEALVATLTGIPAGLPIDQAFLDRELWRRQQGYGRGGRMRIERDTAHILSGVHHGKTIGSPIAILIQNNDWKNWQESLPVEE